MMFQPRGVLAISLVFLIGGVAASVTVRAAEPTSNKRPPNIVLILADDLGYGDLGCYGSKTIATPVLDQLAKEGTRFTHFAVAQAVCTASRAALLTGCYSNRVSMSGALNHTSTTGLAPSEVTLAELCRARGYATAVFGKWHLGQQPDLLPRSQGFDVFAGLPYSNDNGPLHPTVKGIPALPWIENETITERDPDQSQFTSRLTDRAVDFIRRHAKQPFFLYLPHVMPHVPIFASSAAKGKSRGGLYGDVVEELDASITRILAALRESKVENDTLVLFFSDNGPFLSYGTHAGSAGPLREGKLTSFEGGVRVPFIVRWPGKVPAGRTCEELFASIDLYPTLAKLIGAELPKSRLDGEDLRPLLLGEANAKGRESYLYYSGRELHAVREGRWKLHVAHDYLTVAGPPGTGGKPANFANMKPNAIEESGIRGIASRHGYAVQKLPQSLFDLQADPGETQDVSSQHPDIVARLLARIAAARIDLGDALTNAPGQNVRPAGKAK